MLEELKKEVEELKMNNKVLNIQINSHKEVINGLLQENLNARTNFSLSQQYLNESIQNNQAMKADIERLKDENEDLKRNAAETHAA